MNDQMQESRIRLILLDDPGLFRTSLGHWLASEPDFEIAGECAATAEALEVIKSSTVDLVLMDFDAGADRESDFISAAQQVGYQGRFLIVAASADVRRSAIALKRGASGIFMKSEAPDRLVQAIRFVRSGGMWVDQRIIQLLADQLLDRYARLDEKRSGTRLEGRERDVLLGIIEGLTNRKIGHNVGLPESSVKNVVQRLFGKAGVKTRGQLVRVALEGSLGDTREFVIKRQPNGMSHGAAPRFHEVRRADSETPAVTQSND
jgi:two-component system nitrate/nitrite response regulator NarL